MTETKEAEAAPPAVSEKPATIAKRSEDSLRVIVRPLPKVIFFYLTWVASFFCAITAGLSAGDSSVALTGPLGLVWMGIFFFNLLVISFDFNEERSLVMVLGIAAVILALLYFGVLGSVGTWFSDLRPAMNSTFYWMIFTGFTVAYACVWVVSRFNYWEFRPNEVVHRYGIFPKMKRFSTEDMRWDKEVPDVLERILLGSGRLILTTPHEKHPIVIEHVVKIGNIDDKIANILGVKAVVTRET